MNNITEKNVREFIEAINRDALDEVRRLENESKEYNRFELEKAKSDTKKIEEAKRQVETAKIKAQTNRKISKLQFDSKKQISDKRLEIENKVFDEAKLKLIKFAESEKYADFLCESAKKITNEIGSSEIVFFVKEKDLPIAEKLKESFCCTIDTDNTILIGGLKAKRHDILADDTLDERLNEQREWFRMNSSLSIRGD